jgi:hypothetical protein
VSPQHYFGASPRGVGATLGWGTGVVESDGPGVEVSGGGSASTFDPVPGVLPPAVVGAPDSGRSGTDPGNGETRVPGGGIWPEGGVGDGATLGEPDGPVCAKAALDKSSVAISEAERKG